jgi:beta-glucanase (GH16 family)
MVYSNWTNGEAQWYKRANVSEGGGSLRLTAKREKTTSAYSGRTLNYTSGLIHSKPAFNFRYGKMAAREAPEGERLLARLLDLAVKTSSGRRRPMRWSSTATMRASFTRPITVITARTARPFATPDWTAGWHTFTVDWQPGRLTWYVDGLPTKTVTEAPSLNMYLIANLAIANGARAPAPNASTPFPSSLKIDYVRVWKR